MATTTAGNRSPDISYAGSSLASSTTYYWRIAFSDDDGATGAWSTATSTFALAQDDGIEYGPLVENGDFRQYVYYADRDWWKVTDKTGTIYTFGEATSTRQNKEGAATTTFK
jgi:hypothetical protein